MSGRDERRADQGRDARNRVVRSRGPIIRTLEFTNAAIGIVAVIALILSLSAQQDQLNAARRAVRSQTQGRHFAVGVTCAALSAVSQAGYEVIDPPRPQDSAFTRALERLGYPPLPIRQAQAKVAAQAYVQSISRQVQSQVGGEGARLIRKNGTIDCERFQQLSGSLAFR